MLKFIVRSVAGVVFSYVAGQIAMATLLKAMQKSGLAEEDEDESDTGSLIGDIPDSYRP